MSTRQRMGAVLSNISFWEVRHSFSKGKVNTSTGPEIEYQNADVDFDVDVTEISSLSKPNIMRDISVTLVLRPTMCLETLECSGVKEIVICGNLVYGQCISGGIAYLFELEVLDGTTGSELTDKLHI